ncbi:MAG: dynamin family protein, partial [Albidovulum sp.]
MSEHIENLCENGKTEDRSFMKNGFDLLSGLRAQLDELSDTLLDIDAVSGPTDDKLVAKLKADLQEFQPSITMIGQIKSGKTSLVNAIVGRPGLLPADVNPWTSVVTSLHLNAPREADAAIASFQFFNASEWDHLVSNGG